MIDRKDYIIMVDVDNTLFGLVEGILPYYNSRHNDNLQLHQITDYNMYNFIKKECSDYFEEFNTPEIYESIYLNNRPYGNSVEVLTKLNEIYTIMFCTAGYVSSMIYRHRGLQKYFPFYTEDILNRVKYKTSVVKCAMLIDDYEKNLIGADYMGILYSQNWNKHISTRRRKLYRLNAWDDDTFDFIKNILES